MRRFVIFSGVLFFIFSAATVYLSYRFSHAAQRYGYIDVVRLLEGYKLKIDLTKKVEHKLTAGRNTIDSLQLFVNLSTPGSPQRRAAEDQAAAANYKYQNELQAIDRSVTEQVWGRLNPLIYSFSQENKLSLLMGATGNGNVLYGDSTMDYTRKFLQYANEQYENK